MSATSEQDFKQAVAAATRVGVMQAIEAAMTAEETQGEEEMDKCDRCKREAPYLSLVDAMTWTRHADGTMTGAWVSVCDYDCVERN